MHENTSPRPGKQVFREVTAIVFHNPSLVGNLIITVRYHWNSLADIATYFRAEWVSQDMPLYGH